MRVRMHKWSRLLVVMAVAGVAFGVQSAPAQAAPSGAAALDSQIAQVMTATPGGVRVAVNQVAWDGGRIVLTLPVHQAGRVSPATSGLGACGTGFWCLYQNANYNQGLFNDGRMLSLTGCDGVPGNLTNFGFNDQASSWYNNSRFDHVSVYKDINGGGGVLWVMNEQEQSSNVGAASNDKASSINCPSQ